MSATGIGAAVRRKEDHRFITGKGHYTDDISRPGQTYAWFVRSPHAHATIKSIDARPRGPSPACSRSCTGTDLAADKIGNLICGWMIHSKDGSPMKMAPHPALASGKACHVGDPVAVVVAETLAQARDAAEAVKVDYGVLPAVADPATAQKSGAAQIHEIAPNNTIYQWHLGDQNAVEAAFKVAAHVTRLDVVNNRLVPNAIEPRAAIGEYDSGTGSFTLWNTTQNPHVARLVIAAFVGMAPENKLRVIAPDVGGGFGSKIFIYPEEVVALWASKQGRTPGQVGVATARKRSSPTRTDATTSLTPRWRSMPAARSLRCAPKPLRISAPICRHSRRRCRLISTVRCCRASMRSRRFIARWTRSTPTPCRSTPIAVRAARKRPSSSNGWSR